MKNNYLKKIVREIFRILLGFSNILGSISRTSCKLGIAITSPRKQSWWVVIDGQKHQCCQPRNIKTIPWNCSNFQLEEPGKVRRNILNLFMDPHKGNWQYIFLRKLAGKGLAFILDKDLLYFHQKFLGKSPIYLRQYFYQ